MFIVLPLLKMSVGKDWRGAEMRRSAGLLVRMREIIFVISSFLMCSNVVCVTQIVKTTKHIQNKIRLTDKVN